MSREYSTTETAKIVRRVLKGTFPATTFSVKSRSSAIDVSWTDGPARREVDHVVGHFRAGNFNGMEDSYTYDSDSPYANLYIFTDRRQTLETWQAVQAILTERYPQVVDEGAFRVAYNSYVEWTPGPDHTSGIDWDRVLRTAANAYDNTTQDFIYPDLLNTFTPVWQHAA